MIHPAITLSRSFGSGGSRVGFLAARSLGWRFCDRRILQEAARNLGVSRDLLRCQEEKPCGFLQQLLNLTAFASPEVPFTPPLELPVYSRELFEAECSVMRRMLEESPAVLVGRGGFVAFRDRPSTLHVRIQASTEFRMNFLVEHELAPDPEAARKAIERADRDRTAFLRDVSGEDWQSPNHFDLVLDVSEIGFEACTARIVEEARSRFSL